MTNHRKQREESSVWDFLDKLDDDLSKLPERRKRPESSPIRLSPTDLLPVRKKKEGVGRRRESENFKD